MTPPNVIDATTVRQFVTLLHERADKALAGVDNRGVLHLCTIAPDSPGLNLQEFNIGDVDHMVEAAILAAESGNNVYVEGRTVRSGRPGERGKINATVGVFGFCVDRDVDTGKAGRPLNGDASAVVETSPGGNVHEWIFLERALTAEAAKPIGETI